jgi:hypothetical protein
MKKREKKRKERKKKRGDKFEETRLFLSPNRQK